MGTILSPRLDSVSELRPNLGARAMDDALSLADGLTAAEALELVTWLKKSGYVSIDVVPEADHCSVQWSN